MALDSVFVAVVFAVELAEVGPGFVVGPAEAGPGFVVGLVEAGPGFVVGSAEVDHGIVAVLAEVGLGSAAEAVEPGTEAVAVLALDTAVAVLGTVAVVESGQDNVAEVVELEVDRVVAATTFDPDIAAYGQLLAVAVPVLNTVVAKDVLVADGTAVDIVVETIKQ